jgi:glycosyltransferase involved in cell wall biosynthesis
MPGHRPRVSVALPVYNGERYLAEAIASVQAQTYEDFELIIGDNASTDGTEDICRARASTDHRITYLRHSENLGAAPNYNRLFEISTGEYFKWIAHDDGCAPDFIERAVQVLDDEPEVVVCYSKSLLIDESGSVIERYSDGLHLRSSEPHERLRTLLDTPGWCNPIFGLIRRSALTGTPLIANYPRSDRTLLAELTLRGEFFEIPDHLLYRRIHPNISTEVHVSEKDLAVWYDSKNKDRRTFPRWRRYFEYVKMTGRSELPITERARVLVLLGKNALSLDKVRGLVRDVTSTRAAGR